ncbi:MAG: biopolymer transporter ExbD [Kiritimatiellales bacterium]|jgi:biopolymer transport protein ExbD
MQFKIPTEGGDDEINMAPMIDMVFLLLIFFMVASHLTSMERVPVSLPVADKAKVPEEARDRQIITVQAEANGGVSYYMNLQKVDIKELSAEIARQQEKNENVRIYLRADRQVRHKHIKAVMEACAEAGIADIIFGVFESGN